MSRVTIAAIAALALSGAAHADFDQAAPGDSADLDLQMSGQVEEACGITASSNTIDLDYGVMTRTSGPVAGGVNFGFVCNSAGGATVGVSSANGGFLLRNGVETGPGKEIYYSFDLDKGDDEFSYALGTRPVSLASDRTFLVAGSDALREGRVVGAYIVVWGVRGPDFQGAPTTTVYAGSYSDTITVSLAAQ